MEKKNQVTSKCDVGWGWHGKGKVTAVAAKVTARDVASEVLKVSADTHAARLKASL